jgi:hypothetical protein
MLRGSQEDIVKVRHTMLTCVVAVLGTATATVHTAPRAGFSRIVAFGTSLSDRSNAFALGTNTPPESKLDPLLFPSAPYTRGVISATVPSRLTSLPDRRVSPASPRRCGFLILSAGSSNSRFLPQRSDLSGAVRVAAACGPAQ